MADVIRPYVGSRVLEIGAGIGNMTMHLIPRTAYWATDINPAYLEALSKAARDPALSATWRYTNAIATATLFRRASVSTP